jgi:hypothetical protein
MSGDAAAAYAKAVVSADFDSAGGAANKVSGDLAAKGMAMPETELRARMIELMAQAIAQVQAGR